jgi:predicted NUDIX family phosphoesterase
MSTVETEQVMVVPTSLFHECGHFQGFSADMERYLTKLLANENTQYLPRGDMEADPTYKQLIPYCIFRHTDSNGVASLFQYTRGKGQGESRLHSKRSIGIGGHISTLDADEASPYEQGMQRELDEEVNIAAAFTQKCVGLINDDENEVGKVHLGVVHIFDVESPEVTANEEDIIESGFVPVAQLKEEAEQFETWSQICLESGLF